MKILYAVQATGNGHITRARTMARAFKKLDIEVDWLFSGREREQLFDMQLFGDYQCYRGLTFRIKNGQINHASTIFKNNIFRFLYDLLRIDLNDYDLLINDFEPLTAWAAKLQGIKTIGISHQMAFQSRIPLAGKNLIANSILKYFAPVSTPVGLHWNDFGQSLLPPVIDHKPLVSDSKSRSILVYFPFCDAQELIDWFAPFDSFEFHLFHGEIIDSGHQHIHFHPFSRDGFIDKQLSSSGIITGAGFELPSEAIHMGHKLLVLPLAGQMEQQSNALALEKMNRAMVLHSFSKEKLKRWLTQPPFPPMPYPNVALEVAKWLVKPKRESLESLSTKLWALVEQNNSPSKKANHAFWLAAKNSRFY